MNTPRSPYKNIFNESATSELAGDDGADVDTPNLGNEGCVHGNHPSEPVLVKYAAVPGVKYTLCTGYDYESDDITSSEVSSQQLTEWIKAIKKDNEDSLEEPDFIKKLIGPIQQAEFKGTKGGGILGRTKMFFDVMCVADTITYGSDGEPVPLRCRALERACYEGGVIPMRAAWNDFKSKMIVPKCFNAPEVVSQAYWIYHEFADRKDEQFKDVFTAKYEADGGKYVPAGGDDFKQVAVIVWSLELDAMIALFEKAWKEMGDGQYGDARPFLVVVEMEDGTKELQVGDFGARMFFTGPCRARCTRRTARSLMRRQWS